MIRKLVLPISRSIRPTFGLINICIMNFSPQVSVTQRLASIVRTQITHQESQKSDLNQFTNFFQNQGWTVSYNDIQIELSKKQGQYNLKVLSNAKTPMSQPQEQENEDQNQQQDGMNEGDFHEINVYVNRQGSKNWLCANFIHQKGYSQVATVNFTTDYQKQKKSKLRNDHSSSKYVGPDLNSLQQKLAQSILQFINDVGVNNEILSRVYQFSINYEHKFYLQWLKDLESII